MPTRLLMPVATAVWLVENSILTFKQIADLCNMHELEVQNVADGELGESILGQNPVESGQITAEELARCEADPNAVVQLKQREDILNTKTKRGRYTPISKRRDKPDAIAFLLKTYPQLSDAQIMKLVGTTRPTIQRIRENAQRNSSTVELKDPVLVGLCSAQELDLALEKAEANSSLTTPRSARFTGNPLAG